MWYRSQTPFASNESKNVEMCTIRLAYLKIKRLRLIILYVGRISSKQWGQVLENRYVIITISNPPFPNTSKMFSDPPTSTGMTQYMLQIKRCYFLRQSFVLVPFFITRGRHLSWKWTDSLSVRVAFRYWCRWGWFRTWDLRHTHCLFLLISDFRCKLIDETVSVDLMDKEINTDL